MANMLYKLGIRKQQITYNHILDRYILAWIKSPSKEDLVLGHNIVMVELTRSKPLASAYQISLSMIEDMGD
jgi:aromatic ring hydroxylase